MGISAAGLFGATALGGSLAYGSPQAALARLRGDKLTAEPSFIDFGAIESGQTFDTSIAVRNWTDRPIRLVGGTSDCSCIATDGLPATIEPGEVQSIPPALDRQAFGARFVHANGGSVDRL